MNTTTDKPALLRTMEKTLPVKLTTTETLQHGRDMAKARRDWAVLDDQRKSVSDDFKSRLQAQEMVIERHARAVETGEEPRQVECADELVGNEQVPLALRYIPSAPWYRAGPELRVDVKLAGPGILKQALLAAAEVRRERSAVAAEPA